MHAIQITEHGSADVMRWVEVDDPSAVPAHAVVELGAAGLNFIDTYQRSGLYQMELPYVLGLEGAGTVVELGDGVTDLAVGDRVAWWSAPGSYAERVVVPAGGLMHVPDGFDWDLAAALPLQGMTAHYLTVDTYALGPGDTCLIHAGAGGVGLLLIQIAKLKGAEVYTTVGTPEKAELAAAAGADHTILYRDVDFADAIRDIAGTERPLDVVYDGVGKSVFSQSLGLIRTRGMMVTFGNASGPVDPVSPLELSANGSIFLTRPKLFDYVIRPDEIQARADDLFAWHAAGELDVRIGERFALSDAADAHRAIESRTTTGKVVLLP